MRAGEVVCKCSICVNCVHLMQPQRRKEEGWCAAFRSVCNVCNVCNVQCTVSKGGGEGGVHVALITSCIILQCHRRRERWVKVCSLCKMGEVVNKCTSVLVCTICTFSAASKGRWVHKCAREEVCKCA